MLARALVRALGGGVVLGLAGAIDRTDLDPVDAEAELPRPQPALDTMASVDDPRVGELTADPEDIDVETPPAARPAARAPRPRISADPLRHWKETEKKARARRAFELMPPLQQPGSDTDEWYVKTKIFPALQTGSWTRLFAPRFNPRQEWVGAPRNGGYAFAPGERSGTKDEFGVDTAVFEGNDNVGFLPGFNRITSVIQVSLDPMGDDVQKWFKNGGQ